ncbi:MAG: DUF2851 family protein [Winogradskyella sp.]|nr:DUF2851 family protein [Winogradskyella sp.]
MREDLLHYIWKHKKIDTTNLKSVNGEQIDVVQFGQLNTNSGPDFFNAQLKIDNQLWAGNVEIHLKSSDWYAHHHETDSAYDNVILHVVWEHDIDVYRKDNSKITTLQLKDYISSTLVGNYQELMHQKTTWINCENDINAIDSFIIKNWLERLYIERLERKATVIKKLLVASKNNWEAVLFKMMLINFGLKVNKESFQSIADALDFAILQKVRHNNTELEALLFGVSGLLDDVHEDAYCNQLKKQYEFLKSKFSLQQIVTTPKFFRLRPNNFPTIRLSQLANLYATESSLFSKLMEINNLNDYYNLLEVSASDYWQTHYSFSKTSKRTTKKLSKSFIDLLLINTIIPVKFAYQKERATYLEEEIIDPIQDIKIESNSIVDKFLSLRDFPKTALTSQALLELKQNYCDTNRCLQCAIGSRLVLKN